MTDTVNMNKDRRKLLSLLGLGAVGAFVAPAILQVSSARASGNNSGGSSGGGSNGGGGHLTRARAVRGLPHARALANTTEN